MMGLVWVAGAPVVFLVLSFFVAKKKLSPDGAAFLTLFWPLALGFGVVFGIPIGFLVVAMATLSKGADGLIWLYRQVPRLYGGEALPKPPPYKDPHDVFFERLEKEDKEHREEHARQMALIRKKHEEALTVLQAKSMINTKKPDSIQ